MQSTNSPLHPNGEISPTLLSRKGAKYPMSVAKKGPMWRRSVFTLFDSQPLAEAIAIWAGKEGFSVIQGEPLSPDIVTLPAFALVVDRTLATEDVYDIYLEVVGASGGDEATRDKNAMIVVDTLRCLEYPPLDVVVQIDLGCPYAIRWILHTLDMAAKYIARMEE